MAKTVKNLLAMHETWVGSLGHEEPLEKGMTTHSSILALRIPRGAWRATAHGVTNCWSFNGPEPGGPESKREKEADIPWFTRKANRALFLGLALLQVGTGRPLEWVKAQ